MKIARETYFSVQYWMVSELNLKTVERDVYAIIYGFSQDGESDYHGSLAYLAQLTGYSRNSICTALKNLVNRELIIKDEKTVNNIKFCRYKVNLYAIQTVCTPLDNSVQDACTNNIANKQLDNKKVEDSIINNTIVVNTNSQNFTFGTKQTKPKKQNLYSRCVALINNKTDDKELQKLLVDWLNMLLEKYKDREKVLYENVFKGKLNTLDEYDKKDWKDIIQYNLQRGYEAFYPIKEYKHNDMEVISSEYGIVNSYKYTDEERKRQEEWRAEMKRNGKRIEF